MNTEIFNCQSLDIELKELINSLPKANFSPTQYWYEYEQDFKIIIIERLRHCLEQLKLNKHHAKFTGDYICWEGGHFTIPVYIQLRKALNSSIYDWNSLIWQQIARYIYSNKDNYNERLFMIATESMLASQIKD